MSVFCSNCGKELADTAKFCNRCGEPTGEAAAPVAADESKPESIGIISDAAQAAVHGTAIAEQVAETSSENSYAHADNVHSIIRDTASDTEEQQPKKVRKAPIILLILIILVIILDCLILFTDLIIKSPDPDKKSDITDNAAVYQMLPYEF